MYFSVFPLKIGMEALFGLPLKKNSLNPFRRVQFSILMQFLQVHCEKGQVRPTILQVTRTNYFSLFIMFNVFVILNIHLTTFLHLCDMLCIPCTLGLHFETRKCQVMYPVFKLFQVFNKEVFTSAASSSVCGKQATFFHFLPVHSKIALYLSNLLYLKARNAVLKIEKILFFDYLCFLFTWQNG